MYRKNTNKSGFSLIEVLVAAAVMLLVFGGLFAGFQYSLKLIADSRAKVSALSLASDRMEYLRSLPYDEVGTISGIPNGLIPQNSTTTLNGIDFNERILIEYIDDPADGLGVADSNGVLADYKKVKVEYTWTYGGSLNSFFLTSSIMPRSIETTAGGGSLRVNVFNSNAAPLPGISVRLLNTTTTSTIDVTRLTDASGIALFTGAPAASNYEIFVFGTGYSSDQTYKATTTLPNPTTLPVAILEGDVSTMNFQVDRVSNLTIQLLTGKTIASLVETFDTALNIDTFSNTEEIGGKVVLTNTAGIYNISGRVMLNPITPAPLEAWGIAKLDLNQPTNTEVRTHFYTSTSTSDLVPESDLPGNLAGFLGTVVDLSSLDVVTYTRLIPGIELSTSDTAVTPEVLEFSLFYVDSVTAFSGSNLSIKGNKTIGTLADASLVYKYNVSTTTDSEGKVTLNNLEWGVYDAVIPGYDIAEACAASPYVLNPNKTEKATFLLTTNTVNNLRVAVQDGAGKPLVGADVELDRPGYNSVLKTGWCGQVFFGGIASSTDYTLDVSASGYTTQNFSPLTIDGSQTQTVTLSP